MSHRLNSPIARQDIRLDITDLYLFRGQTGTVFVINVCHSIAGAVPSPGTIRKACTSSRLTSTETPSKTLPIALRSMRATSMASNASVLRRIGGAAAADPHAAGARGGARDHRRAGDHDPRPVCASGPARPAIRFRSSLMCCTRSATPSRTVRRSTCPDGSQARRRTCLPVIRCIRSCWKCRTASCLPRHQGDKGSAHGQSQRSRPTRGDGVRSIA